MSNIQVKENEVDIKIREVCANDGSYDYRYILTKEWDNADRKVTVIMYNPSDANYLMYDKTVMNVENFLKKKGYNKINIVNLFAIKHKKNSIVSKRNIEYEKLNDDYIKEAIEDSNLVILAWGYGKENPKNNPKYVLDRIKHIEKLVKSYVENMKLDVRCFIDDKKTLQCHPQNMNIDTWDYESYEFKQNV